MSSVLVCDGDLTFTDTGAAECSNWLAVPSEMVFIADLFQIPPVEDLQNAFMLSFSLVMITYLASWGYGLVIQFATSDKHQP